MTKTIVKVTGVVHGELPESGMVTVNIKGYVILLDRKDIQYVAQPGMDAPYMDDYE